MDLKEDLSKIVKGMIVGAVAGFLEQGAVNYTDAKIHTDVANLVESGAYATSIYGYERFRWPATIGEKKEQAVCRTLGFMVGQTLARYLW